MVWLNTADRYGNGIYLNIHLQEIEKGKGEPRYLFSGIIGDGFYEGEVSLQVGEKIEIDFLDEWWDRAGLEDFFDRVDRPSLERSLEDVVRPMTRPGRVERSRGGLPRSAGSRKSCAPSGGEGRHVA